MKYSQLISQINKSILGENVISQTRCYGRLIQETSNGVFVDRVATDYKSLEEARENIKQQTLCKQLEEEIQQEQYASLSENKIVNIIKQHHGNIRITDTLIESYVELASSKLFTLDAVANSIRQLNKLDQLVEGHIDFKLDDGTVVVVSESTFNNINSILANYPDIITQMRMSKDQFFNVIKQIEV